jgi:hypothetical protein
MGPRNCRISDGGSCRMTKDSYSAASYIEMVGV